MTNNGSIHPDAAKELRKSGFADESNAAETLDFSPSSLGQRCPQDCPHPNSGQTVDNRAALGPPMGIAEVAKLLGCSAWTVRQRYMRQGLPYIRASASGRVVFFRYQVIYWIFERQRKGGKR